ncbi:hypothetical protein AAC03nite_38550 [Alicyclobacillus acidoterrestris]|nr:hypothetical protein AAC03nite_38550 [Alicyclobacillus acidoterrestris]
MNKKIAVIHDEMHPLLEKIFERLDQCGFQPSYVHWSSLFTQGGGNHPLIEFDTVYLDRMGETTPSYSTQILLLKELVENTPSIHIVNSPGSYFVARNKALMAGKLVTENLPTPITKICHNESQIEDFCQQYGFDFYIAKSFLGCCAEDIYPFANGRIPKEACNILHRDGMIIVQEFVYNPERFIWRVDVVNNQVIQCNQRFAFNDDPNTPLCNGTIGGEIVFWAPEQLPRDVRDLAIRAVNALGLVIAGVDILVSRTGDLFIAEVNPEPDITLNRLEFPYAIADYLSGMNCYLNT